MSLIMNLLFSFTTLLFFQLVGSLIQIGFSLPIPGSVIGMILLFIILVKRKKLSDDLQNTSLTILYYLPLLFVPAGVGVIQQLPLLKEQWLPISTALVFSSIITLIFTGLMMQFLLGLSQKGNEK